jgi:dihydrofolate reductase
VDRQSDKNASSCRSGSDSFVTVAEARYQASSNQKSEESMRKLIVSEFVSLDGVMQAPGGADEDTDGGFKRGGWTLPYWHDDIGLAFGALMQDADALLLGRKTYVIHANAFEPMKPGDQFGDMMNAPAKYVVSSSLEKPLWRNTTIIRDDIAGAVRKLKAAPGKNILTDGSHQLVHTLLAHDLVDELHLLLYPIILGGGKRLLAEGTHATFKLKAATPYPSGVVGLCYERDRK